MEDLTPAQANLFAAAEKQVLEWHDEDVTAAPGEYDEGSLKERPSQVLRDSRIDFEDDDEDEDSNIDLKVGYVHYNGIRCFTQQYVGEGWEKLIVDLQNAPDVDIPDKFVAEPHSWQKRGAAQIHHLCKSRFLGGILADSMGLGKTFQAVIAMELARGETGAFSLVVCPASCKPQWMTEIPAYYKKGLEPKVLVLEDSHTTLHTLLSEKWDIIIVSYHFLSASYRSVQTFKPKFASFMDGGSKPVRPTAALHSEFWHLSRTKIKRLVLDECHAIKKEDGAFFKAVRSLPRTATIMMSGTVLSNRWADIANLVTLLGGHHLDTKQKFLHAFCKIGTKNANQYADPDVIALQRFLLAFVVARPSSTLLLPDLVMRDLCFKLSKKEEEQVNESTVKYEKARSHFADETPKATRTTGSTVDAAALAHAVIAQLQAAHEILAAYSKMKGMEQAIAADIDGNLEDGMAYLVERHTIESLKSRSDWLKHLERFEETKLAQSTRIQAVVKLMRYIRHQWPNEKIVIFSAYLRLLDIIALVFKTEFGLDCLRFDGSMSKDQKQTAQHLFDRASGSRVILITSGSGGVGLNIQCASIVVQTEIWWNENCERQAYARCHRQGQKREVKVFRLFASNSSIDQAIRQAQERKTATNKSIMSLIVRKIDEPLKIPEYN